jgi:hypothetical protein
MAIDPSQTPAAGKRFFVDEATTLLRLEDIDPRQCLVQSASRVTVFLARLSFLYNYDKRHLLE